MAVRCFHRVFLVPLMAFGLPLSLVPMSVSTAATVCTAYKVRLSNQTAKDAATDIPSWAAGERPCKTPNEDGKAFASRLLTAKYGAGNYPTGAGSEYSKIQKFGDRAF